MTENPRDLRIGELLARIRVGDLVGVIAALVAMLSVAYAFGHSIGAFQASRNISREEVDSIVATAFSSIRNERFPWDIEDRLVIVRNTPDKHTVLVELPEVPIPQSLRVQFGGNVAPAGQFEILRNILLIAAGGDPGEFKKFYAEGVSVSFVPEPQQGELLYLRQEGGKVFASDRLLYDGERTVWPGGGAGPFGEY